MKLQLSRGHLFSEQRSSRSVPGVMLMLVGLLTFSFVTLISSTLIGLQLGDALLRPNPFAAYHAVWPGQSLDSLTNFDQQAPQLNPRCYPAVFLDAMSSGMGAEVNRDPSFALRSGSEVSCSYVLEDGVFRSMRVTVEGDYIRELVLFSDTLHQDALFLYWGAPDAITGSHQANNLQLSWSLETYRAAASVMENSGIVYMVILTRKESNEYSVTDTPG